MMSEANSLANFDEWWNYNNPAETEQKFRDYLPQAKTSGNTGHYIELLTQIARTLGLQRKFTEAHAVLDEAQGLLTPDLGRAKVRYLLERGRVFNSDNQPDQAKPLFIEAWELGQSLGEDGLAVDAAHMVAIAEQDAQATLDWNLKGMAYAEVSDDPLAQKWLGSLYNNIGWTYHDMLQDYPKALEVFEKALVWYSTRDDAKCTRIAQWCVARTYRSLGRVEEALVIHQEQLTIYETLGEEPGYTYEELGECLAELGKLNESQPYFAKAYAVLGQDIWLQNNEPKRLARLKELGQVTD